MLICDFTWRWLDRGLRADVGMPMPFLSNAVQIAFGGGPADREDGFRWGLRTQNSSFVVDRGVGEIHRERLWWWVLQHFATMA